LLNHKHMTPVIQFKYNLTPVTIFISGCVSRTQAGIFWLYNCIN